MTTTRSSFGSSCLSMSIEKSMVLMIPSPNFKILDTITFMEALFCFARLRRANRALAPRVRGHDCERLVDRLCDRPIFIIYSYPRHSNNVLDNYVRKLLKFYADMTCRGVFVRCHGLITRTAVYATWCRKHEFLTELWSGKERSPNAFCRSTKMNLITNEPQPTLRADRA